MSSLTGVSVAICIFIIAVLLYYQSSYTKGEGFADLNRATWNPVSSLPIAGRWYDPGIASEGNVPADLNKAQITVPSGSLPLSQQRPSMVPTGGTSSMPREALAQIKDLRELDSKIVTWLDAAGQKERDTPGSLTSAQSQQRIMLTARLNDIRDQIGTGVVIDSWSRVAEETRQLRDENAGWGQATPSLEAIGTFGVGASQDSLLSTGQFTEFNGIFNSGIREMQGLAHPDPLQKVRIQQLQVIRQELLDYIAHNNGQNPPIKMGSAQLFLRQMLKPDQPLPSLMDLTCGGDVQGTESQSPWANLLSGLSWSVRVTNNPAMMNIQPFSNRTPTNSITPLEIPYDPADLQKRAVVLCSQIREAFGEKDAVALGCPTFLRPDGVIPVGYSRGIDSFEAETVINTVCERLRVSVPDVDPAMFACPRRTV